MASRSLLLDIARAGNRLVAVGERGHVLLSDDQGRSWVQAEAVPTRALLTGVCFSSPEHGVAVGHDEVILITQDGGHHWTRAHFAPEAQQPLLDVTCAADGRVLAVGAYSVYFSSADGGSTWAERKFEATAPTGGSHGGAAATDGGTTDFHLNRIVAAANGRLYIAGESGHLYRSDDRGEHWRTLPSPYEGSFYGVSPLGGDIVLAFGMRGNLFRSEDAGATWLKIDTHTHAMLNDVAMHPGGALAVVGLSGAVLISRDAGKSFILLQQDDRKGLSAAVAVAADELVTVGEGGVKHIHIERQAAASP